MPRAAKGILGQGFKNIKNWGLGVPMVQNPEMRVEIKCTDGIASVGSFARVREFHHLETSLSVEEIERLCLDLIYCGHISGYKFHIPNQFVIGAAHDQEKAKKCKDLEDRRRAADRAVRLVYGE